MLEMLHQIQIAKTSLRYLDAGRYTLDSLLIDDTTGLKQEILKLYKALVELDGRKTFVRVQKEKEYVFRSKAEVDQDALEKKSEALKSELAETELILSGLKKELLSLEGNSYCLDDYSAYPSNAPNYGLNRGCFDNEEWAEVQWVLSNGAPLKAKEATVWRKKIA